MFCVNGIAKFYIVSGNEISIEEYPGASLYDIRQYLQLHVWNILLNQQNKFLFYGCSIFEKNRTTLFSGPSYLAKSILGQELNQRGYHLISDKLNCIDNSNNKTVISTGIINLNNQTKTVEIAGNSEYELNDIVYFVTDNMVKKFGVEQVKGFSKLQFLINCVYKNELTGKKRNELLKKLTIIAEKCNLLIVKMPEVNFNLDELIQLILSKKY